MLFPSATRTKNPFRSTEALEGRVLLSGTFDVNEVQDFALSQPLIYYSLRQPGTSGPITNNDFGFSTFTGQAYLDTGTSSVVLSQESAQEFAINPETSNGQPVSFTDIGIDGAENFGVSQPLYTELAAFNPNTDVDNPDDWQQVYNQESGPMRMEMALSPSADPFDPTDIWGMPTMQGKVVVMDPTPIFDPNSPTDMNTYIYNPGTPFHASQAQTDPGIPSTSLHVKLSYADFSPYTTLTPADAQPPQFAANPIVGPNPLAAPGTDHTPPLSFARGSYSGTGSFLFDTGAQTSFLSQAEAAKLHVYYRPGTFGTSDPVLVDDNNNPVPNQTVVPLSGADGQEVDAAEFNMDSLTLQTTEGTPIVFHNVPITVLDIGVTDPHTGREIVFDGDFGANFLTASKDGGTAAAFNWVTFDQPHGLLGFAPDAAVPTSPTVVGRYLFYNNSVFDGNNPAANAADDNAIATDKQPLAEGATAVFANYTSYSKGLNGLMVDIAALPAGQTVAASDFTFKVGNDNNPSAWATAPAPNGFLVRPGAGAEGSTRIEFTWPDGAVKNEWLQVTVKADTHTGLSAADIFYFGNAVGESGNSASDAIVNSADELGARTDPHSFMNPATITEVHDYNRDGRVDAADQIIARDNTTTASTALSLIATPLPANRLAAAVASKSKPVAVARKPVAAAGPGPLKHRKTSGKSAAAHARFNLRTVHRLKALLAGPRGVRTLLRREL